MLTSRVSSTCQRDRSLRPQYYLVLARDLDYLTDAEIAPATSLAAEALRLISGLREALRSGSTR